MNALAFAILGYVLIQFVIAAVIARRVRTEADYLLGGRSFGFWLVGFSVFATWFGAESLVGAAGAVYADGLVGTTGDPFGYGLCLLVMGIFFAATFWRMGIVTFGDFYKARYGQSAERLFVVLYVPSSAFWAAAQMRAFGQVVASVADIDVVAAITVASAITIAYTAIGGLKADAVTDLVQGVVLIVGIAWLSFEILTGPTAIDWAAVPAEKLTFRPPDLSAMELAESWAVPVLGSLFTAEVIARVVAARTPAIARHATVAGALLYMAVGVVVVALGLAGTVLLPGLDDPEQLLVRLVDSRLGTVIQVIFAGALISTILSTLDSVLLVAGSLAAHNVVIPVARIGERWRLLANRLAVVAVGILSYAIALGGESVASLVEEASAFSGAGFVVTIFLGVTTRVGNGAVAIGTLLTGMVTYVVAGYVVGTSWPYLLSFFASLAAFAVLAVVQRGRGRRQADTR